MKLQLDHFQPPPKATTSEKRSLDGPRRASAGVETSLDLLALPAVEQHDEQEGNTIKGKVGILGLALSVTVVDLNHGLHFLV